MTSEELARCWHYQTCSLDVESQLPAVLCCFSKLW